LREGNKGPVKKADQARGVLLETLEKGVGGKIGSRATWGQVIPDEPSKRTKNVSRKKKKGLQGFSRETVVYEN